MWRVPGLPEFVTRDEGPELTLWQLGRLGEVARVGTGLGEPGTRIVAFVDDTLVDDRGTRLAFAGCRGGPGGCFGPLESLGTLSEQQRYRALVASTSGRYLFGLVDMSPGSTETACTGPAGCEFHRVDRTSGTVTARARWPEVLDRVSAIAPDPLDPRRVWLASGTDCVEGGACDYFVLFEVLF